MPCGPTAHPRRVLADALGVDAATVLSRGRVHRWDFDDCYLSSADKPSWKRRLANALATAAAREPEPTPWLPAAVDGGKR